MFRVDGRIVGSLGSHTANGRVGLGSSMGLFVVVVVSGDSGG